MRPSTNTSLDQLAAECDRAAREFLAIEGWNCPRVDVRKAVDEMIACSRHANFALAWLLSQTTNLPVQVEPARRLQDLVKAISALRDFQGNAQNTDAEKLGAEPKPCSSV